LNLTQLRKNARKRPDKTSGRKRPRLQDVDVVAAGDVDDATTSAVVAAVTDQPTTSTDPAAVQSSQPAANADYRIPGMVDPPDNPRKTILWIECELCLYWYHQCCVGVKKGRKHWKCPRCPWLFIYFNCIVVVGYTVFYRFIIKLYFNFIFRYWTLL